MAGLKRDRNSVIDKRGRLIVENTLPEEWLIVEQKPDYGKDFVVEIVDGSDVTGELFFVQLKSQERHSFIRNGEYATFSMKSKHCRYYSKLDFPVILFLVDISTERGYFVFLQEYLSKNQQYLHNKTLDISVPISQSLADSNQLRSEVNRAKQWLRVRYPKIAEESMAHIENELKATDPRFDYKSTFSDGSLHHEFKAKELVELKLDVKGNGIEKVRKHLEQGFSRSVGIRVRTHQ